MSILLATLCLNEVQWIEKLYLQHKDWPGAEIHWVFVESADRAYQHANPDRVSELGLSVDGTSEFLGNLAMKDSRVRYIAFGFSGHDDPALGKCETRQACLDIAELIKPEFVINVDADEFYTHHDQVRLLKVMRAHPDYDSFIFNRREVWRSPRMAEYVPLFSYEVVGGFWGIPCCHWWRWRPGMHHRLCHNTAYTADDRPMNKRVFDARSLANMPEMVHMGFAAWKETRLAKNKYYANRGEAVDPQRAWYCESRAAWKEWKPGVKLPRGAKVIPYQGPVPEIFKETSRSA